MDVLGVCMGRYLLRSHDYIPHSTYLGSALYALHRAIVHVLRLDSKN